MSERKVFRECITLLPVNPDLPNEGLTINEPGPGYLQEKMIILFSLVPTQDMQECTDRGKAGSKVIADGQGQKDCVVDQAHVDTLVNWLRVGGFRIEEISKDRTSVYAEGTMQQIETSLCVKMISVTKNGLRYNIAKNAPSLPAKIGENVHAIIGLQPFPIST